MKTPITLETKLKKGDIITKGDYNNMVLGVLDELYFISNLWADESSERSVQEIQQEGGYFYTIGSLVRRGYSLLTPDWSPDELKEGDEYWYVENNYMYGVQVERDNYSSADEKGHDKFTYYKKLGLVFPTKEEAEAKLKQIMSK